MSSCEPLWTLRNAGPARRTTTTRSRFKGVAAHTTRWEAGLARFDDLSGMARMHSGVGHLAPYPLSATVADPSRIARMIETQIIPRLMLLHGEPDRCDPY